MNYDAILFDLDGTLLDTSTGVINSVLYAVSKMGIPKPSVEQLYSFIGPSPVAQYMKVFNLSESMAKEATLYHRQYSIERGVREAKPYPTMAFTLCELKKRGCKLGVATLKCQNAAETILTNYGLQKYFDVIVGMNLTETLTKSGIIRQAIQALGSNNTLMVGDTIEDYIGASENNCDFIGVLYGYGFKTGIELEIKCIHAPCQLLRLLV